ncbi:MAG: hypothetical protein HY647_00945 [Acidobacteria bacterium]|nr:hypothetical protein [Acidobacteriota bacterium]
MAERTWAKGKFVALLILVPLCVWLVYRNIVSPAPLNVSASVPPGGASPAESAEQRGTIPRESPAVLRTPRNPRSDRSQTLNPQELAAMDPTLRLDLLEQSRQVKYEGASRNIFELYTPPPPPAGTALASSTPALPKASEPAPINIPWKFYGMAVRPGSFQKKAFLTDGVEIFIGEEGSVIAKQYKILRIGVNSIELEDIQSQRKHQLPLLEQ